MTHESNRLKLENAALRAENTLLKRYLTYFENLFAKKNWTQLSTKEGTKNSQMSTEENQTVYSDSQFKKPRIPIIHKIPDVFLPSDDLEVAS